MRAQRGRRADAAEQHGHRAVPQQAHVIDAVRPRPPCPRAGTGLSGRVDAKSVFIDRALYLPWSWTGDPDRCQPAGIPGDTAFAAKPAMAEELIGRASMPGPRPGGWPRTRSMAGTPSCAPSWPAAGRAISWR